jgi:hypothetical protein
MSRVSARARLAGGERRAHAGDDEIEALAELLFLVVSSKDRHDALGRGELVWVKRFEECGGLRDHLASDRVVLDTVRVPASDLHCAADHVGEQRGEAIEDLAVVKSCVEEQRRPTVPVTEEVGTAGRRGHRQARRPGVAP